MRVAKHLTENDNGEIGANLGYAYTKQSPNGTKGYRQVVRHMILAHIFVGSSPTTPEWMADVSLGVKRMGDSQLLG